MISKTGWTLDYILSLTIKQIEIILLDGKTSNSFKINTEADMHRINREYRRMTRA